MPTAPPPFLTSESELREHMPGPPERTLAKIQPRLEETARAWIGRARLVGLATRRDDGAVDVTARALDEGLAEAPDDERILVRDGGAIGPAASGIAANPFAAAIFMLPGLDSTLRANGTARAAGGALELDVHETYMHCPKAFVRSGLWKPPLDEGVAGLEPERGGALGPAGRAFVERAPFALLGTCLPEGHADVSPRGDPPGFVHVVDARTLLLPDRPGNRIADSFRNLLANPVAGLLFLVPGLAWALRVTGEAHATADPDWLAPLAVKNRAPKLGIWIRIREAVLEPAPALDAARTWSASAHVARDDVPSVGRAIVSQIEGDGRLTGAKGWVLDRLLDRDAKKDLY